MPSITVRDVLRLALPPETNVVAGAAGLSHQVTWIATPRATLPAFVNLRGGELVIASLSTLQALDDQLSLATLVERLAPVPGDVISAEASLSGNLLASKGLAAPQGAYRLFGALRDAPPEVLRNSGTQPAAQQAQPNQPTTQQIGPVTVTLPAGQQGRSGRFLVHHRAVLDGDAASGRGAASTLAGAQVGARPPCPAGGRDCGGWTRVVRCVADYQARKTTR